MSQLGKEERNKDALMVVSNVAGQRGSSFVCSCAKAGGRDRKVRKETIRHRLALGLANT